MNTIAKLSLSLILALTISLKSFSQSKTYIDYWNETGITFDILFEMMDNETCYKSEKDFIACVYSIQKIIEKKKAINMFIPKDLSLEESKLLGVSDLVDDNEFMRVVLTTFYLASDFEFSQIGIIAATRAFDEVFISVWKSRYRADEKLNFTEILKILSSSYLKKDQELSYVLTGANKYYEALYYYPGYLLPLAMLRDDTKSTPKESIGLGFRYSRVEAGFVVMSVHQKGSARRAGMKIYDIIVEVDGRDTKEYTFYNIGELFSGERGDAKQIKVKRGETFLTLNLVRDIVEDPNVGYNVDFANNGKTFLNFSLNNFRNEHSCRDIKDVVNATKEHVHGYILDLRQNGGGRVDQAECIADLFLKKDQVIATYKNIDDGSVDNVSKSENDPLTTKPLVLLIDEMSASASEILAGALADNNRAILVGTRTYGKGTQQRIDLIQSESLNQADVCLAHTDCRFYRPAGPSTQIVGIDPHVWAEKKTLKKFDPLYHEFRMKDLTGVFLAPSDGEPVELKLDSELSECIKTEGKADELFEQNNPIDYQYYVGKDVLSCLLR